MKQSLPVIALAVTFWTEACDLSSLERQDAGDADATNTGDAPAATREAGTKWTKTVPSCSGDLQCKGGACCESFLVTGGSFAMGRGDKGTDQCTQSDCYKDELPEHTATVGDFYLDAYEVTVGRFRKYVDQYTPPKVGDGAHPKVAGSGWQSSWNYLVPKDSAELASWLGKGSDESTWTPIAGPNENKPMNQITWFELFMFCAWDGGRLPTEAEWEYAAAGAGENRMYPWGPSAPNASLAVFDTGVFGVAALPEVGSKSGRGRWLQHDLAGSLFEWTMDATSDYAAESCIDCIRFDWNMSKPRIYRGGYYGSKAMDLRAANRSGDDPIHRLREVGGRCARDL